MKLTKTQTTIKIRTDILEAFKLYAKSECRNVSSLISEYMEATIKKANKLAKKDEA